MITEMSLKVEQEWTGRDGNWSVIAILRPADCCNFLQPLERRGGGRLGLTVRSNPEINKVPAQRADAAGRFNSESPGWVSLSDSDVHLDSWYHVVRLSAPVYLAVAKAG